MLPLSKYFLKIKYFLSTIGLLKHDLQGERRAQRGAAAQQRRGAQQRGALQVRCYSVRETESVT